MSWCVPLWFNPVWDSLHFLDLDVCFLSQVRKVFSYYVLSAFLSLSSPSGFPIMRTLVLLMFSQRSLKLSSFLFILFFFFCSASVISTTLSSSLLIHSSASFSLQLIPSSVFLFQLLYSSSLFCCSLYFPTLC